MPTMKLTKDGKVTTLETQPDEWKLSIGTVMINGGPTVGKTTSITTWPGPRHVIICPGEMGYSSIEEIPDEVHIYRLDVEPGVSPAQIVKWASDVARDIIAGKYGKVTTIAVDGFHKLIHQMLLNHGWPGGANFDSNSYGKGYGYVRNDMGAFLLPITHSSVPYKVFTCWDKDKAMDGQAKDKTKVIGLPGDLARTAIGEFPITLYANKSGVPPLEEYYWEIQTKAQMRAAGVHVPLRIKKTLPAKVPQDWMKLEALLLGSVEPVPSKTLLLPQVPKK